MPKTVYSLVLSSRIVAEVDRLAASRGYSRSALINSVLASYVGFGTPEQQAENVLESLQKGAQAAGLRPTAGGSGTLTLRTALGYKYNPALTYVVQLSPEEHSIGQLRVGLRSQNQVLLHELATFFRVWEELEQRHMGTSRGAFRAEGAAGRYSRILRRPASPQSDEEQGGAIHAYITLLNGCLQAYFAHGTAQAQQEAERCFTLLLPGLEDALEL